MAQYDHNRIETKWQSYWEKEKTFKSHVDKSKPKYYILDMFPYPSGAGLHVGHVTGYTATDILARYKRQMGYNVLHPMGWDSFGLPAEQYAIRTGTHPAITTEQNIDTYRRQLKSVGFSYDWNREIKTSDPKYYKWTQWIFTKLFERGLAYEADVLVNYCPELRTVLANEEVENGRSKEGGYPIERRPLRQWVLKITEYADRLLSDLDEVDWPDYLKRIQQNWIGKSEGAHIHFASPCGQITVFTTCPHTLFGCSYLVLAPEHPFVDKLTTPEQKESVRAFKASVAQKSDLERTELAQEKQGAFLGSYAKNPINGDTIPIWISDYVLMGYGSGAVMAVPAHDERDFDFAQKYHLPIKAVIDPLVTSDPNGIPEGLSAETIRLEVLAGKRCWPYEGEMIASKNDEIDLNGQSTQEGIASVKKWLEASGHGKSCINYRLRDWLFSRQRYWGEPFPILHFADGTTRALELDELPLTPPELEDFKPAEDGNSPLAKVREWVEIVDPKTGKQALRETNTMPQWAGSCWYYLRFCDPHNDKEAWSREAESYWMPVDLYVGGVEHAVLHLLYSRFWHKVLYDCGLVTTKEPFQTMRNQGLVTAKAYKKPGGGYVAPDKVVEREGQFYEKGSNDILIEMLEKMSKSKLNGVTPDEIIEEFGADSLRLYEMFMAPFDREKIWNSDAVNGCRRFLNRVFEMATSPKISENENEEGMRLAHRLVKAVQDDIEAMSFNTAVAKMMEFMNHFTRLESYPKAAVIMAIQTLYPFAPHLAEECYELLGGRGSIAYVAYPKVEARYLVDDMATYVVQINGKVRGKFELPKGKSQEELIPMVQNDPAISRHLTGTIEKIVFVPDRLISFVIKRLSAKRD